MVGFWLSTTVTVWLQVAVRPLPSVTVQVTVLAPNTKLDGLATVLATLQLSAVVGAVSCELAYVHTVASVFTLILHARVMVGLWLSTTCAGAISVNTDATVCTYASSQLTAPTTADNCSVASTVASPSSLVLGANTVTWTVTDGSGRTATCNQTVTVVDNQNPTITCAGYGIGS